MAKPLEFIEEHARMGIKTCEDFFAKNAENLLQAAFHTALAIARGNKMLVCDDGCAADAQHVAAEFVNRFSMDRPALPAIALTTNASLIIAMGNDLDFEQIFSRQVEALGRPGDILLAISSSANNASILHAAHSARERGLFVIGLTGPDFGVLGASCDILLDVPSERVHIIQEIHMIAEHAFCRLVDYHLFENVGILAPYLRTNENEG